MTTNDIHTLVDLRTSVRWDMVHTYQWVCSCGAVSAVRWSSESNAKANHPVHVEHEQENP